MGDVTILVSPAEPPELRAVGVMSPLAEEYGADFLWGCGAGLVAVQRKTVPDLLASLQDGRLAKEIAQLAAADVAVLLVEGRPRWTAEGRMIDRTFRREAWLALLMSLQFAHGLRLVQTEDQRETALWLRTAAEWFGKPEHRSLRTRPKPLDSWGEYTQSAFELHLLQSFPGVGPELAERIVRHFGGVPLRWTVGEAELRQVRGIGPERARAMVRALDGGDGGREKA
jgi:DNA excision repair protein ERCC-4